MAVCGRVSDERLRPKTSENLQRTQKWANWVPTKKVGQVSGMSPAEQSHEWLSAAECQWANWV